MNALTRVNQLVGLPGVEFSTTSLQLPEDLSFEDWGGIGTTLGAVEGSVMWWLGDWWAFGEHRYGDRRAAIADIGVNFQTAMDAGWVARRFETSRRREVLPWTFHKEVAALDADVADRLLDEAASEGLSRNGLRERVRMSKLPPRYTDEGCTVSDLHALIKAGQKSPVIYADPPWAYRMDWSLLTRGPLRHYDTQPVDEIKSLPVANLAADDCVLLLWTTPPQVREALELIQAWGFEYKTFAFVWVKENEHSPGLHWGMGNWTRANVEFVMLAIRGAPSRMTADIHQVVIAPVSEHSRKPDEVRVRIEQLLPGPYLELYGRRATHGWTVWGNDITRSLFHQSIPEFACE